LEEIREMEREITWNWKSIEKINRKERKRERERETIGYKQERKIMIERKGKEK
jgi:hypothetical protein